MWVKIWTALNSDIKNSLSRGNIWAAATAAKLLQSCLTLCNPIDSRPPGSPIPGILQARTLEWVAISFSNAWKWNVKVKSLSHVRLFATPWTAAYQAPLSMGFSRQEYWSGVPLPSLTNLSIQPFSMSSRHTGPTASSISLLGHLKHQVWHNQFKRTTVWDQLWVVMEEC